MPFGDNGTERWRAVSWVFGCPTDMYESYISPSIWIIDVFLGSHTGLGCFVERLIWIQLFLFIWPKIS